MSSAAVENRGAEATMEPLRSSWIQRLKPSAAAAGSWEVDCSDGGELQIPLKNLALGDNDNALKSPRIGCGSDKPDKGFGSFRVRVAGVKFRKPPLPPSSNKPIKPSDCTARLKPSDGTARIERSIRTHQADVRLEQLQQRTGAWQPRDPLAEFASRFDIREKSTPVGTFHVGDRKVARKKNKSKFKKKGLVSGLTPVVSSKGSFTFPGNFLSCSANQLLQLSSKGSAVAGSKNTSCSVQGNQSHASMRTISTACCGSSPFPETIASSEKITTDCSADFENICAAPATPADQEVEELGVRTAGKRSTECSDRLVPSEVKRSRLSAAKDGPVLAGPWLNRWTIRDGPKIKPSEVKAKVQPQQRFGLTFPRAVKQQQPESSAAALAIVGAAMRQIQTYTPRVEAVKVHTGL